MSRREVRPYGTWPSPVTPQRLVEGAAVPGEVRVDGDDIWWSESRPGEGGRVELVRCRVDGSTSDLLGSHPIRGDRTWNVRTALGEYGGGAWCVESGVATFAQWDDQRLYRVVADDPSASPVALTPPPAAGWGLRYGDVTALNHHWLLAVREAHPGEGAAGEADEPVHEIVAVPADGSAVEDPSFIRVLVAGPDFVASPRPGPARLAWMQWDHPQMPWDGTELCVARLAVDGDGAPTLIGEPVVVAGGADESVVGPEWDGEGQLWFSSDRSGWWNLYCVADPAGPGDDGVPVVVAPVDAEIGGPRWVGGLRWCAPLPDGRVLASMSADGSTGLVVIDPCSPDGPPRSLALDLGGAPLSVVGQVVAGPGPAQAVVIAASARSSLVPLLLDLPPAASTPISNGGRGRRAIPRSARRAPSTASLTAPADDDAPSIPVPIEHYAPAPPPRLEALAARALRSPPDVGLAAGDVSVPEAIKFPSVAGREAHALLYRPTSDTSVGPGGDLPPLIVMIHGGPTSAARPMLDLTRQLWTTRGFAVVDVDYGGSTGYGRPYRRLLDGQWGVVDVEDCIAAARHLADEAIVDGDRMVIRGGSAGGFTTLVALCTSDAFAAGTSLYGVADLAALAADTHKFESRYLDGLVGPWPEASATYAERSPLGLLDDLATPLLVLQGAEDAVVPPDQAEAIVAAVAAKGLPHAYLLFEGEGHGFRRADTIISALQAELAFYGEVLGFTPADDLPPLPDTVNPSTV